jgi:hypothetical protein
MLQLRCPNRFPTQNACEQTQLLHGFSFIHQWTKFIDLHFTINALLNYYILINGLYQWYRAQSMIEQYHKEICCINIFLDHLDFKNDLWFHDTIFIITFTSSHHGFSHDLSTILITISTCFDVSKDFLYQKFQECNKFQEWT